MKSKALPNRMPERQHSPSHEVNGEDAENGEHAEPDFEYAPIGMNLDMLVHPPVEVLQKLEAGMECDQDAEVQCRARHWVCDEVPIAVLVVIVEIVVLDGVRVVLVIADSGNVVVIAVVRTIVANAIGRITGVIPNVQHVIGITNVGVVIIVLSVMVSRGIRQCPLGDIPTYMVRGTRGVFSLETAIGVPDDGLIAAKGFLICGNGVGGSGGPGSRGTAGAARAAVPRMSRRLAGVLVLFDDGAQDGRLLGKSLTSGVRHLKESERTAVSVNGDSGKEEKKRTVTCRSFSRSASGSSPVCRVGGQKDGMAGGRKQLGLGERMDGIPERVGDRGCWLGRRDGRGLGDDVVGRRDGKATCARRRSGQQPVRRDELGSNLPREKDWVATSSRRRSGQQPVWGEDLSSDLPTEKKWVATSSRRRSGQPPVWREDLGSNLIGKMSRVATALGRRTRQQPLQEGELGSHLCGNMNGEESWPSGRPSRWSSWLGSSAAMLPAVEEGGGDLSSEELEKTWRRRRNERSFPAEGKCVRKLAR